MHDVEGDAARARPEEEERLLLAAQDERAARVKGSTCTPRVPGRPRRFEASSGLIPAHPRAQYTSTASHSEWGHEFAGVRSPSSSGRSNDLEMLRRRAGRARWPDLDADPINLSMENM